MRSSFGGVYFQLAEVIPTVEVPSRSATHVTCALGIMVLASVLGQRLYIVSQSKAANAEDIRSSLQ